MATSRDRSRRPPRLTAGTPGDATAGEETGRAARQRVPRSSHAGFSPREGRDPIAILEAQERDRLTHLLPLRHERMAESAFAYYRGTPAVMAFDLADTPRSGIIVQASGDAHISNFGFFASPERQLVFDTNDFDETLPAPWEWDVKRLATSVIVAGRDNGFDAEANRAATLAAVRSYREWMWRFSSMRVLDVWYSHITAKDIQQFQESLLGGHVHAHEFRARLGSLFAKARRRDALKAANALTEVVDGRRVIRDDPPLVAHVDVPDEALRRVFEDYRATLPLDRRVLLGRFRLDDIALKAVGVGSVGTRCFVLSLAGRDVDDPLIMQAKEATASVLEAYAGASTHETSGERVVRGQRLIQATPDIFLGWSRVPDGRTYYFRQLWDMKGSVEIAALRRSGLAFYSKVCGWALARAHARIGDPEAIAAYLGKSDRFDGAIADFAEAYADQNGRDYEAYVAANRERRVTTTAASDEAPEQTT